MKICKKGIKATRYFGKEAQRHSGNEAQREVLKVMEFF